MSWFSWLMLRIIHLHSSMSFWRTMSRKYIQIQILLFLSVVTSSINTREQVPLAAMTLLLLCYASWWSYTLHAVPFPLHVFFSFDLSDISWSLSHMLTELCSRTITIDPGNCCEEIFLHQGKDSFVILHRFLCSFEPSGFSWTLFF